MMAGICTLHDNRYWLFAFADYLNQYKRLPIPPHHPQVKVARVRNYQRRLQWKGGQPPQPFLPAEASTERPSLATKLHLTPLGLRPRRGLFQPPREEQQACQESGL
jgi:hypothetical protein